MSTLVEDFRAGLDRGELLVQLCADCGRVNMYPKYACPFCQSENLGWQPAAGRGRLLSHTVQRLGSPTGFEGEQPFGLGVVRLDEDVQLLGRLVAGEDGTWDAFTCDASVEFVAPGDATPAGHERRPIAWFRLVPADGDVR
ncbi:MAG: hypothetical protein JWM31_2544 [Solirubrobacterales bacterium]|nr:hypothetical protein [Solirubrobacterales bacterium]